MKYLEEMLRQALLMLDKDILKLKAAVDDIPEGYLKSYKVNNGKKARYDRYYCKSNGKEYIKAKHTEKAKKLAGATYMRLKILDLEAERQIIESIMGNIESQNSIADAYANENADIRMLLSEKNEFLDEEVRAFAKAAYRKSKEHPERLIYKTKKGDLVRSRAEMIIADTLYDMNIPYRYEMEMMIGGERICPDFVIMDPLTKKIFIIEYLGMMSDDTYDVRNRDKLVRYIKNGYIPSKNLILISETSEYPFDAVFVRNTLQHYFGSFV